MNKLMSINPLWVFVLFILLDIICVGMGMGVPFFCILLGFPLGWFLVRYITATPMPTRQTFRRILIYALVAAVVTLFLMLVLWAPLATYLFDPTRDLSQTGIPMILYEPFASLIGWLVLMILISPFLQLLAIIFSAYLTLFYDLSTGKKFPHPIT